MAELSIICPSCNEYPQNIFTFQNVWCELMGEVDFEFIFIDNWCKEVEEQGRTRDKGWDYMASRSKALPFLKALHYDKKLSHWQTKNLGVQNSTGKFLWFVDAHCIVSKNALVNMFNYYKEHHKELNGTLHLPLSYLTEKPGLELVYKLVADLPSGNVHYSFTRYPHDREQPFQVPCMSTCGMMMTRKIYDNLGGWPTELGIYGGGENFINFTLAVLGKTVNIMPGKPLYHYAEKRGYHWNYDDWIRNRIIATYMFGGEDLVETFTQHAKGRPPVLERMRHDVIKKCKPQRMQIKAQQKATIEDFVRSWQNNTPFRV